jgi:D-3-phosphoglycerate dehydrogenase
MNRKVKIVNVDCFFGEAEGYALEKSALGSLEVEWVFEKALTEKDIIDAAGEAAILLVEHPKTPITRRVIEKLPNCLMIGKYAIGVDNIDVTAATENRIVVCHAVDFCIEEVSDHTVALILACIRQIVFLDRHVHDNGWGDFRLKHPVRRARMLNLGLIGFGRIARLVARKMKGFEMRTMAADPYVSHEVMAQFDVEPVSMETILSESDVISIHTPLAEETTNLIGAEELQRMKSSAFLVNTGRGALVEEDALIQALQQGWITGAALDVTREEPLPLDSALRRLDNVILTPHYGANSIDSVVDLHRTMAESIAALLRGHWPPFPVNPRVRPKIALKPYARPVLQFQ